jgi:putative Mn2+ efflux pump MntP
MVILSLIWLGLGLLIGALAIGARLLPTAWKLNEERRKWLLMPGIGALAALLGGWLGALIWGRLFGTPTALWVSVLVVVLGPWLFTKLSARA